MGLQDVCELAHTRAGWRSRQLSKDLRHCKISVILFNRRPQWLVDGLECCCSQQRA
jgi:hypothetical protein